MSACVCVPVSLICFGMSSQSAGFLSSGSSICLVSTQSDGFFSFGSGIFSFGRNRRVKRERAQRNRTEQRGGEVGQHKSRERAERARAKWKRAKWERAEWDRAEWCGRGAKWERRGLSGRGAERERCQVGEATYLREVPPVDDVACRLLLEIHVTAHALVSATLGVLKGPCRRLLTRVRPIGPYRFGVGTLWAVEAERRIVGKIVRANVGGERTQHICRRGAEPSCRGG